MPNLVGGRLPQPLRPLIAWHGVIAHPRPVKRVVPTRLERWVGVAGIAACILDKVQIEILVGAPTQGRGHVSLVLDRVDGPRGVEGARGGLVDEGDAAGAEVGVYDGHLGGDEGGGDAAGCVGGGGDDVDVGGDDDGRFGDERCVVGEEGGVGFGGAAGEGGGGAYGEDGRDEEEELHVGW